MRRRFGHTALVVTVGCMAGVAYGEAARPDSAASIVAQAGRGVHLWHRACPSANADGACVQVTQVANRHQCGPATIEQTTVRPRNRALVKRAAAMFDATIAFYDDLPEELRDLDAREAAATAHFYLAERFYEESVGLSFPRGLSFDPDDTARRHRSEAAFQAWVKARHNALANTTDALSEVLDLAPRGSVWRVRAYARMGQTYRNYVDALLTAEIPADVRTGSYAVDASKAFCDALQDVAAPLDERAIEAFDRCIHAAGETDGTGTWQTLCTSEKSRGLLLMPPIGT